MFMKYYLLAIGQVGVVIFILPLVVGVFAGLFGREKARAREWQIAAVLIGLINVGVMIDKGGTPFFIAHLFDMFLPAPLTINQHILIGLLGDGLLFLSFWRSVRHGIASGIRLATRPAAK